MRPAVRLHEVMASILCAQLTVYLTEWRGQFRSDMNRLDNAKVLLGLISCCLRASTHIPSSIPVWFFNLTQFITVCRAPEQQTHC